MGNDSRHSLWDSEKMTQDEATNGFIKYWQIIVVIVSMAVGYGSMSTKMDAMAEDVKEQKEEVEEAKEARTEVEKSVIAITKDVEFIKDKLDDQDAKLDRIIDNLEKE